MRFPKMIEIEQRLYSRRVKSIPDAISQACAQVGLKQHIRPQDRVGITVGSRGIGNIVAITKAVVDEIKRAGGAPFVIPAMGSHGGATPAGQTGVLHSLGVTSTSVGAPIRASMAVTLLGKTSHGVEVWTSNEALKADRVIAINRVKQHTDFEGDYESGLLKILTVGLGKRRGAAAMHCQRCRSLRNDIPEAAALVMKRVPVVAGLAIMENGYNETAEIIGLKPNEIQAQEKVLLQRARRTAAHLPFQDLDLLIVDWIGKEISGIGMDPHVIGRRMLWEEPEFRGGPNIFLIAALDLTSHSYGNSIGIGLADLTTERLVKAIDWNALKTNVIHTGWYNRAKLPLAFKNDKEVIQAALTGLGGPDPRKVRMVRIPDTLHLDKMWVSEGLVAESRKHTRVQIIGKLEEMQFDRKGNFNS